MTRSTGKLSHGDSETATHNSEASAMWDNLKMWEIYVTCLASKENTVSIGIYNRWKGIHHNKVPVFVFKIDIDSPSSIAG